MTLATMADRSLPLAERVQAALSMVLYDGVEDVGDYALAKAALLADVAAADRLALADSIYADAHEEYWDGGGSESLWELEEAAMVEHTAALDAYRARMQGVADG